MATIRGRKSSAYDSDRDYYVERNARENYENQRWGNWIPVVILPLFLLLLGWGVFQAYQSYNNNRNQWVSYRNPVVGYSTDTNNGVSATTTTNNTTAQPTPPVRPTPTPGSLAENRTAQSYSTSVSATVPSSAPRTGFGGVLMCHY